MSDNYISELRTMALRIADVTAHGQERASRDDLGANVALQGAERATHVPCVQAVGGHL